MKISQEAREAASKWEEVGEAVDLDILAADFQSLINSTLERAAGVAEWLTQSDYSDCDIHAHEIATAIRQLIEE